MQDSEALALVAVLQAAFPRFTGGEPTARLFATKLARIDAEQASRGINNLIDNRQDSTWPSWAEVLTSINQARPRHHAITEGEPAPLSLDERRRFAHIARQTLGRIALRDDA